MKNLNLFVLFVLCSAFVSAQSDVSNTNNHRVPSPNYKQAEKYSPTNLAKLVHSTSVRPNWLKNGNRFWYQYKTSDGSNYYIVDADRRTKTRLFDNDKMAKWLTEITKDPYDGQHLLNSNLNLLKMKRRFDLE